MVTRQDKEGLLVTVVITVMIFAALWSSALYSEILIKPPEEPVYQGQEALFIIRTENIESEKVTFFYRAEGTRYYQKITEVPGKEGGAEIKVPAAAIVYPAIEFYVKVIDKTGKVSVRPNQGGEFPLKLNVVLRDPLAGIKIAYSEGSLSKNSVGESIVLEAKSEDIFRENQLVVILDNMDVTELISINKNKLSLSMPVALKVGPHQVTLSITSKSGVVNNKSWSFQVADNAEKNEKYYVRGGGSLNYGQLMSSRGEAESNALSANLSVQAGLEGDDWQATANGINLQYVNNTDNSMNISSGFYFDLKKGEQLVQYGDVNINETQLTAPAFSRRGIRYNFKSENTEVHLFDVGSATVTGFESGINGNTGQVYGASVRHSFLKENSLPFSVVYISGENNVANGFNAAGTQSPGKGDVLSVSLKGVAGDVNLSGELARSYYDRDVLDAEPSKNDIAVIFDMSTMLGDVYASASYFRYGSDFYSISNPNFTADREGVSATISTSVESHYMSMSLQRSSDNVNKILTKPVVYNTSATVSWGVYSHSWPGLNVSYTRTNLESKKEPVNTQLVKSNNNVLNLNLSKSGRNWNVNLSNNFSRFDDEAGDLDSRSKGIYLSASYTPSNGVSLIPAFSMTESEVQDVVNEVRITSLSANMPFFDNKANTSLQLSYTENNASDGSVDSDSLNGALRFSMDVHDYVKKWFDFGSETLALSFNYNSVDGLVNSQQVKDDYSVYVSLNMFFPFDRSSKQIKAPER